MLLVVAAFEPELAPLRAALGERLGEHVVLAAVGIGLLEAPLGTIAALDRHQPESLLFVGTAGFYPPSTGAPLAIGDLVVAKAGVFVREGDRIKPVEDTSSVSN